MKVHSPGNTSTPRADLEWSRGDDGVVCGKGSKGEIDWPVGRGEAKIHYINGGGRCLPILNPHKDLWRGHGKPNCTLLHKNASLSHLFESEKNQES